MHKSVEEYEAGGDISRMLVATYGEKTEMGYPVSLCLDIKLRKEDGKGGIYVLTVCGDLKVKRCYKLGLWPIEAGGQCLDDASAHLVRCGLVCKSLEAIVPIWEKWHNNNTHIGTPLQEDAIEKYMKEHPEWHFDYNEAREILQEYDLLYDKTFVVDGKPFEYGIKWLKREIPDRVIRKLCEIIDSPMTIERIPK